MACIYCQKVRLCGGSVDTNQEGETQRQAEGESKETGKVPERPSYADIYDCDKRLCQSC